MPDECCECCADRESSRPTDCPNCSAPGHEVSRETLEAMLLPETLATVGDGQWCFCGSPGCDVVYFDPSGGGVLSKTDLRVRVGIKETEAPRPLCYCFGHTVESITEEWERTGHVSALDQIERETRAGDCRCTVTNPGGRCCLPTVRRFVADLTGQA